jgi:glycosyltransferase A (GT-A) superfamily protein (DUF2064 family)
VVVLHDGEHVTQDGRVQLEAKLVQAVGQHSQNVLQQQQVERAVETGGDRRVLLDVQQERKQRGESLFNTARS